MNFALSSILIIILLFPGAICIYSYYTSFNSKEKSISIPILDSLLWGLVFSIILHSSFLCVLKWLGYEVNVQYLYSVISGKDTKDFADSNIRFFNYTRGFFFYMIIMMALAFFGTKGFKKIVFENRLELKHPGLVNYNYWFSIFSLRFIPEQVDLIYIDVMVSNNMLYSGILWDYMYNSRSDELETLVLKGANRRRISDNGEIGPPMDIPSDMFIIKATEMLNINFRYISITPNTEKQQAVET